MISFYQNIVDLEQTLCHLIPQENIKMTSQAFQANGQSNQPWWERSWLEMAEETQIYQTIKSKYIAVVRWYVWVEAFNSLISYPFAEFTTNI